MIDIIFWMSFVIASVTGQVEIIVQGTSSVSSDNPIPEEHIETIYVWPCTSTTIFGLDTEQCYWNVTTGETGP
jgi:hypothetical protein